MRLKTKKKKKKEIFINLKYPWPWFKCAWTLYIENVRVEVNGVIEDDHNNYSNWLLGFEMKEISNNSISNVNEHISRQLSSNGTVTSCYLSIFLLELLTNEGFLKSLFDTRSFQKRFRFVQFVYVYIEKKGISTSHLSTQ